MPIDRKYGHVTLEHGAHIPDDEPVVVFRARDTLLPRVLAYYRLFCWKAGSPKRHLELIDDSLEVVERYQQEHAPVTPTSATSRAWLDAGEAGRMSTTETTTAPSLPGLVLSALTLNAIQAEATRAHLKHGENSMMGTRYTSGERLAILMEEVGEVAHELTYDQDGDRDKLVKELIQVAAMAATWVEFLEGGGSQEPVVLPSWAEMSDLDKGAALLHLSKRENEGTSYAMENYPACFFDHPALVALSDEDASCFAVSMEAAAGTVSDAEYERLSDLAADAGEKRWATEQGEAPARASEGITGIGWDNIGHGGAA